jgi:hypothetical protein
MISVNTKDWLRKASGIWLLLMGVTMIVLGIYGLPRIIQNSGEMMLGGLILGFIMILFGIILLFAGISVLHETLWGIAFAFSIILCIVLGVLSPHVFFPVIYYIFLGISVISTVSLFVVRDEF